jgi:SAM-dependent methyltransferase
MGFDAAGEVFISGGRIFRGIYSGHGVLYREILQTCQVRHLFEHGIVATKEVSNGFAEVLDYELLLEHERVPFITYPHEWAASMLKDAALLHIDLFLKLGAVGLTLKDWHPHNILFQSTTPVFIDFASIIPSDRLRDEAYLSPPKFVRGVGRLWQASATYLYEMYCRMFVPYFLLPLYLMAADKQALARKRLFETTLNASSQVITSSEVFVDGQSQQKYLMRELKKKFALLQPGPVKTKFFRMLHDEIDALKVSPTQSDYIDYYAAKNEDFPFEPSPDWTSKQRVVYQAIREHRPTTLLDLGSNTGWFSVLAAKMGCEVLAVDIDEACVDRLYDRAKKEALHIQPLVMQITNLTPDVVAMEFENEPSRSLIGGDSPLLLAAEKRLGCDMVLALALVHHLALGSGLTFEQIVNLFDNLTVKYLVVEFVDKEDPLIVAERDFFSSYYKDPQGFYWYTLENFISQLKRAFRSVDVKPSHPESRRLIICAR